MKRVPNALLSKPFPLIGVVHLPALPGAPFHDGRGLAEIEEECVREAQAFQEGGFDGVFIENAGDGPGLKRASPDTVAAMGALVHAVVKAVDFKVGVSAGYDASVSMAVAAVTGASFIRVPVFAEASVTQDGIVEATAAELLRYRKYLGAEVAILADVYIKHTSPLSTRPLEAAMADASSLGCDALILTGVATGSAPSADDLDRLKRAISVPLLIGSGVTASNVASFAGASDGAIVGTYCKDPDSGFIDVDRVRGLRDAATRIQ